MPSRDMTTILEITDTHVKLVQARHQHNEIFFAGGGIRRIEQFTDEAIAGLVSQLTAGRDISPEQLACVIPRRLAIVKQLHLPSHSESEVHQMVQLQLHNHMPYVRDDVAFDCQIIGHDEEGYSRVFLTVVHKDVLERYLHILQRAKLAPAYFWLSSSGIQEWMACRRRIEKSAASGMALVVNIDSAESEICFCGSDHLFFSRSVRSGHRHLLENGVDGILQQIGLTLGTYRKDKMGSEVTQIFLVSTGSEGMPLKERLSDYYHLPVEVCTPFDDIPCLKNANMADVPLSGGVSLMSPVGLLFADSRKQMNFLPAQVKESRRVRRSRSLWMRFLMAFVATAVLSYFAVMSIVNKDAVYLNKLEKALKINKEKAARTERRIKFFDEIRARIAGRILVTDVLAELHRLTPGEITLQSLSFSSRGELTIQGMVSMNISVNSFQQSLIQSPFFKDVKLEYATKRRRLDGEYTDFKIVCQLRSQNGGAP